MPRYLFDPATILASSMTLSMWKDSSSAPTTGDDMMCFLKRPCAYQLPMRYYSTKKKKKKKKKKVLMLNKNKQELNK
jgi:hypothetical protein